MSTLAVIATSTLTGVIGAAAMYVPARLALRDARTYRDEADKTFGAAESLADEVERTRNLPWHYAAIEAADPDVTGEVLAVAVHDPAVAAGLARLADEVGLVQALSEPCCTGHGDEPCAPDSGLVPPYCCGECPNRGAVLALSDEPEHDDEDAPADDTDRPGLCLVLLAIPVALWQRVREWFREEVFDRFKSDEQRDAEFRGDVMPYRGKHWASDVQHTGTFPIVPAQRSGDADA